jgi:hypothetical protein
MQVLNEPSALYGMQNATTDQVWHNFEPETSSIYLQRLNVFSDKIARLLQQLNGYRELLPDWDSYNAEAPSKKAINAAMRFIIECHHLALPFYFTSPGVDGEVMLEFQKGVKSAELYFLPDASTELVLFQEDEFVFEGRLPDHFDKMIQFFKD